jgi:cell division protein FtsB
VGRHTTTSIKRPATPAADEGRSRLGDFTRPIPVEKRLLRRPRLALFGGVFVLAVSGTIAAAVFVLPIQTWFDQDAALAQLQDEHDELVDVNGALQDEVDRLETDDGIREAAREFNGFVGADEDRLSITPPTELPRNLPDGWPYRIVTDIIAARTAGPAPAPAD